MIENAKLSIVVGGFYHCSPKWDRSRDSYTFDNSFSFLLPVTGGALMETVAGQCQVRPGHVYFIPSAHMVRQTCAKEMSVYWINFVSESFYLHHRLTGIRAIHEWPLSGLPAVAETFRRFGEFFESAESDDSRLRADAPAGLAIQIEGVLLWLTGNLIESTEADFHWGEASSLERLKPAIDFLDEHYLRNPPLSEIAQQVNLAPDYFHRLFKAHTGQTPFKYMENRRLDLGRKLLFDQRLNVTEVAQRTGYASLYYFSRAFRRRFGMAPSLLRRAP